MKAEVPTVGLDGSGERLPQNDEGYDDVGPPAVESVESGNYGYVPPPPETDEELGANNNPGWVAPEREGQAATECEASQARELDSRVVDSPRGKGRRKISRWRSRQRWKAMSFHL